MSKQVIVIQVDLQAVRSVCMKCKREHRWVIGEYEWNCPCGVKYKKEGDFEALDRVW